MQLFVMCTWQMRAYMNEVIVILVVRVYAWIA